MQRLLFLITIIASLITSYAQKHEHRIAKHTYEVDSVLYKIYNYERIGVKATNTPGFDSATRYLFDKYTRLGYEPIIDTFKVLGGESYNIIVEKPGSNKEDKWIIVGAHYDSVLDGPGANDNGSGVVGTLEIAKLIKDVDTRTGIRIINFGAEEQGFLGSTHYVKNVLDAADDIELMLNLDQLGGTKGEDNSKIKCERDEDTSPSTNNALSWLKTDTLANLMSVYTNLTPIISNAYSSDYVPFEAHGHIITGLYQASTDNNNHTSKDVTANMDIEATTEVIKGALATTLYFARINTPANVSGLMTDAYTIYPNPITKYLKINIGVDSKYFVEIRDYLGNRVLSLEKLANEPIDVSNLANGLYTVSISIDSGAQKHHSKVIIAR
ncbi:M20/M25/M40 family metallo-hydrolase [Bacteroidia bacterium]|nr:M20/M25/M40 family metallo-hydrolase [Bacteroidia bacterium]